MQERPKTYNKQTGKSQTRKKNYSKKTNNQKIRFYINVNIIHC